MFDKEVMTIISISPHSSWQRYKNLLSRPSVTKSALLGSSDNKDSRVIIDIGYGSTEGKYYYYWFSFFLCHSTHSILIASIVVPPPRPASLTPARLKPPERKKADR